MAFNLRIHIFIYVLFKNINYDPFRFFLEILPLHVGLNTVVDDVFTEGEVARISVRLD